VFGRLWGPGEGAHVGKAEPLCSPYEPGTCDSSHYPLFETSHATAWMNSDFQRDKRPEEQKSHRIRKRYFVCGKPCATRVSDGARLPATHPSRFRASLAALGGWRWSPVYLFPLFHSLFRGKGRAAIICAPDVHAVAIDAALVADHVAKMNPDANGGSNPTLSAEESAVSQVSPAHFVDQTERGICAFGSPTAPPR